MLARAHQRGDGNMHRGHAARGADGADAALERGDALFQNGRRRIRDACIDVPGALEIEQRGRMIGVRKDV